MYSEAAESFMDAITKDKFLAVGYYQLGACYYMLNFLPESLDAYDQAFQVFHPLFLSFVSLSSMQN
jgi:hypothetical protein